MRRLILFFLLFTLVFSGLSCIQTKISSKEKQMLFTYDNIADYTGGEFQNIDQCETYQKVAILNLLNQYTYTFESSKAGGNEQFIYINSVLQRYPSVLVAKQNMLTQAKATQMVFNISLKAFGKGIHLKDDNRLFTLGDHNYHSYILNKNNQKIGNFILTRVERSILQVMIMGLYFDDQELLDESMSPTVDSLRKSK